ncbi:MAG: adenylate/guanylate cyclase domain-containing protein [Alteripontixanthobacter sp.]
MSEGRKINVFVRGWRNVREAGTNRLALTGLLVLLALLLARYSWYLPVVGDAERALFDVRAFTLAEQVEEQDERLLMVVYDDQTLMDLRKRSPLDRGVLATALANLDQMGPKAIGIDILFDQPQDEDQQLIDALSAMETPVSIAFVQTETNEDDIIYEQQLYLEQFLGALEGTNARAASVRLDNADGVTRNWPNIVEGEPDVLGRAMLKSAGQGDLALPDYEGAVRYRLPAFEETPIYTKLPIGLFAVPDAPPELLAGMSEIVQDRYVLIGGDIVDYDRVETSFTSLTGDLPPGLQVHATMIAQMLDRAAHPQISEFVLWALALLIVLMAVLTGLLEWGSWRVYLLLAAQFTIILGVAFGLHSRGIDTFGLPAFGWLAAWVVAFTAVTSAARASGAVQRNFAQGALGKYLPREMAREIIDKPDLLSLHGEKKHIYVLFSDLEGFTKMSHALSPEMVAKLLNRYLEVLSQVVLDHGGVIDKFVGDAVVAFWGAPIARDDDATRAAKAGYAMWRAGEDFREEVAAMDANLPKIGKTRVGLHYGEAVVGNFGGESRIQYTALGDSMNTAARLEAASKPLQSSVMASREFAERSGLDWWRQMGRIVLRGRAQPVDLFEPAPDFPDEDRAKLARAMELLEEDRPAALKLIEEVANTHPNDTALQNLLKRSHDLNGDNAHVLG